MATIGWQALARARERAQKRPITSGVSTARAGCSRETRDGGGDGAGANTRAPPRASGGRGARGGQRGQAGRQRAAREWRAGGWYWPSASSSITISSPAKQEALARTQDCTPHPRRLVAPPGTQQSLYRRLAIGRRPGERSRAAAGWPRAPAAATPRRARWCSISWASGSTTKRTSRSGRHACSTRRARGRRRRAAGRHACEPLRSTCSSSSSSSSSSSAGWQDEPSPAQPSPAQPSPAHPRA